MDEQQNSTTLAPLQPQVVETKQSEESNLAETAADQPETTTTVRAQAGSEVVRPAGEPKITRPKPQGPSFFGYKPPKWAHDFDYVRVNKGKGKPDEAKTWLLHTVDRLLKVHSV